MKSEEPEHEEVKRALQEIFPAMGDAAELRRDLWSAMLNRIHREEAGFVPWYDWVLAAAVLLVVVFFPKIALLFACHL